MVNKEEKCPCGTELERVSKELEALKEDYDLFQRYMLEVIEGLTETGNRFLGITEEDYYDY